MTYEEAQNFITKTAFFTSDVRKLFIQAFEHQGLNEYVSKQDLQDALTSLNDPISDMFHTAMEHAFHVLESKGETTADLRRELSPRVL